MTNGRVSNFIGATFSAAGFGVGTGFTAATAFAAGTALMTGTGAGAALGAGDAAALARGVFAIASLAITGFAADLLGFTVTFDVATGFAFVGGRAAFLEAATFGVAFLGVALPGRFAALLGFFEGI